MADFKDRKKGFENKFAHDQEMLFRINARRNRLIGEWAAGLMGLTAEETDAYANMVEQFVLLSRAELQHLQDFPHANLRLCLIARL